MKKFVLILSLCLLATAAGAQVIFYVEAPSPNEGNYSFTYAEPGTWGVADLTDPVNSVTGEMVLIDDGTDIDNPIGCDPVINDLTGKVAVLYRGSCEFGSKALNAQNAGAIAVVIINNLGGEPVDMGAGDDGASVTIPVVMITNIDGALLRDEIDAGTSTVFIGSKTGLYANDIGFTQADLLRAESFGNLQQLSQDASEFSVQLGTWVRNYGTNAAENVVLNCLITLEGTDLYDVNSDPIASIPSGDSVFVPLDDFEQSSYANGYYHCTYTVSFDAEDESGFDNTQDADFVIDEDYYSIARMDEETLIPINSTNQFNGTSDNLFTCMFFQDPNASRVGIQGMNFSGGTSQNPDPTSLDGLVVEAYVYEWLDDWTDLTDPDFALAALNDVTNEEYIYTENLQSENIYIPFTDPVVLEDDMKYLFCVQMYGTDVYPGYDTRIDYNWNVETYAQPINPIFLNGQWFALGFGTDRSPSISAHMFDADEVGLVELPNIELTAYPNPATTIISVPLEHKEGNISMTIVDINGKVVAEQNAVMNNNRLDIDVTTFAPAMYTANLQFEDGQTGTFHFVVTK